MVGGDKLVQPSHGRDEVHDAGQSGGASGHGLGPDNVEVDVSLVASLGRLGLWEEKNRLEERRKQLTIQTRQLAFENYPTFIAAADSCQHISAEFAKSQTQLDNAIDSLPKMTEAFAVFKEKAQSIQLHRKRASMVLSKHPKLLEVLELPQLMETCVKNGNHEEALAIIQMCGKLHKSMGHIPLVKHILDDVHASSVWMLNQLLAKLKTQIQLPECLKTIGFIRRMGAFNETQLRLKYLQARESHFGTIRKQCGADKSDDRYNYLCKVIEMTRICVFDTITQYRALFSDDDINFGSGYMAASGVHYRQIFPSWLSWKLQEFLNCLAKDMGNKSIDDQALQSLLGQAMYFGQSLGRVGYDFRVLLVPIFLGVVMEKVQSSLQSAITNVKSSVLEESGITERTEDINLSPVDGEESSALKVNYYALAEVANGIATACNKLRFVSPVVMQPILVSEMQRFIEKSADILKSSKMNLQSESDIKGKHFRTCLIPQHQFFIMVTWDKAKTTIFPDCDNPPAVEEAQNQFLQRVVPFSNKCLSMTFAEGQDEMQALNRFGLPKDIELELSLFGGEKQTELQSKQDVIVVPHVPATP